MKNIYIVRKLSKIYLTTSRCFYNPVGLHGYNQRLSPVQLNNIILTDYKVSKIIMAIQ